jgi:hypothetical protein
MITNFGGDLSETQYNPTPRDSAHTRELFLHLWATRRAELATKEPYAVRVYRFEQVILKDMIQQSRGLDIAADLEPVIKRHEDAEYGKHVLNSQLEG